MVVVLSCNFVYDILNCYKMWAIPSGTSSALKKKNQVKSPSIWSRVPETGSDPQIGSDRESGRDKSSELIAYFIFGMTHYFSEEELIYY